MASLFTKVGSLGVKAGSKALKKQLKKNLKAPKLSKKSSSSSNRSSTDRSSNRVQKSKSKERKKESKRKDLKDRNKTKGEHKHKDKNKREKREKRDKSEPISESDSEDLSEENVKRITKEKYKIEKVHDKEKKHERETKKVKENAKENKLLSNKSVSINEDLQSCVQSISNNQYDYMVPSTSKEKNIPSVTVPNPQDNKLNTFPKAEKTESAVTLDELPDNLESAFLSTKLNTLDKKVEEQVRQDIIRHELNDSEFNLMLLRMTKDLFLDSLNKNRKEPFHDKKHSSWFQALDLILESDKHHLKAQKKYKSKHKSRYNNYDGYLQHMFDPSSSSSTSSSTEDVHKWSNVAHRLGDMMCLIDEKYCPPPNWHHQCFHSQHPPCEHQPHVFRHANEEPRLRTRSNASNYMDNNRNRHYRNSLPRTEQHNRHSSHPDLTKFNEDYFVNSHEHGHIHPSYSYRM